jgi:outer membrane protein assembly factor BamB
VTRPNSHQRSPGLYALDAADGRRIWTLTAAVISTPAVTDGVVYALGQAGAGDVTEEEMAALMRERLARPADQ